MKKLWKTYNDDSIDAACGKHNFRRVNILNYLKTSRQYNLTPNTIE